VWIADIGREEFEEAHRGALSDNPAPPLPSRLQNPVKTYTFLPIRDRRYIMGLHRFPHIMSHQARCAANQKDEGF
jgi:hypothetical protein